MFFVLLDPLPDPYQNVTDPQHCQVIFYLQIIGVLPSTVFLCNITNLLWPIFLGKMFRIRQDPDPQHCEV